MSDPDERDAWFADANARDAEAAEKRRRDRRDQNELARTGIDLNNVGSL